MSEWLDPVESTRDLIAALEKDRGACEAEIVDLAAEREAVLRAMGEAASRLELQETKIDALQGQDAALREAVDEMDQSMEKVRQVSATFQETAGRFRHIKTTAAPAPGVAGGGAGPAAGGKKNGP